MCISLKVNSVWAQIINSLDTVRSIFAENEICSKGLKAFTLNLVASATEKIGWDFGPHDGFLSGQLRTLLIGAAGSVGHEK